MLLYRANAHVSNSKFPVSVDRWTDAHNTHIHTTTIFVTLAKFPPNNYKQSAIRMTLNLCKIIRYRSTDLMGLSRGRRACRSSYSRHTAPLQECLQPQGCSLCLLQAPCRIVHMQEALPQYYLSTKFTISNAHSLRKLNQLFCFPGFSP